MRIANVAGRLALVVDGTAVDVETASKGEFGHDVQAIYERWDAFRSWGGSYRGERGRSFEDREVGSPAPRPAQVFAIGVNYASHAKEAKLQLPERPMVFTKFPAAVTGPYSDIALPPGSVDFEVELVAVIGKRAENVGLADAWEHVAGLTNGQDVSERELQLSGPPPQQFSLGKSFPGFAPMGPVLVTPDEFANRDDIEIGCAIDGVVMQRARTSEMIHSIPKLVSFLSSVLSLLPGDVIFTGTPAGIGWARNPKRMLQDGETLTTFAESIGEMRNRFVKKGQGL